MQKSPIISARRSLSYIQEYMEQIYVDKFASINEKFTYKKRKITSEINMFEPILLAQPK